MKKPNKRTTKKSAKKAKPPKKKAKRPAADEPKWRLIERVVALLEKSIAPDAEVLHNQKLRDITTGEERQCDVVVKTGKPPRQLTTIVEVQKRSSAVSIGTFDGWVKKRDSVGAHCLLCVSAKDYPASIKKQVAMKYGPSVRLLTLKEMSNDESAGSKLLFSVPSVVLEPGKPALISTLKPEQHVPTEELHLFRDGDTAATSVSALVIDHFDRRGPTHLVKGQHHLNVEINIGRPIYSEHKGVREEVKRLVVPVVITVDQVLLPMLMSSYEQMDVEGAIAWVAIAQGTMTSGEKVDFRMTFVPNDNGFRITAETIGADRGGYLIIVPLPERG